MLYIVCTRATQISSLSSKKNAAAISPATSLTLPSHIFTNVHVTAAASSVQALPACPWQLKVMLQRM